MQNILKGKSVYEEEGCKQISKNMIKSFENKYPWENANEFKYFQILAIIEYLIDGD